MRRLWVSVGLILALCALAGWHVSALGRLTATLTQELEQAQGKTAPGGVGAGAGAGPPGL